MNPINTLTLIAPDDWHIHLRDSEALATTVPHAAASVHRAMCMPNLVSPVKTVHDALAYRKRILSELAKLGDTDSNRFSQKFEPLMTLYLTESLTAKDIEVAAEAGVVKAVKLYPAGATTNSADGVTNINHCTEVIAKMEALGLPLLVHGEVTDADIDIFDREAVFIDRILIPLRARYPKLKVVLEHITTRHAAEYVASSEDGIASTITAHHLLYNRNAMLVGGIRPHYFCLPILKRESHREALIAAAASGNPRFFLGTDSAPHAQHTKENACGCAGCYTALHAMELYATAFEQVGALDKLEGFSSVFGAQFYGLPLNTRKIRLLKEEWTLPETLSFVDGQSLVPLNAGETMGWRFAGIV